MLPRTPQNRTRKSEPSANRPSPRSAAAAPAGAATPIQRIKTRLDVEGEHFAMNRTRTDWTGVAFGVWLGVLAAYHPFQVPAAMPLPIGRASCRARVCQYV